MIGGINQNQITPQNNIPGKNSSKNDIKNNNNENAQKDSFIKDEKGSGKDNFYGALVTAALGAAVLIPVAGTVAAAVGVGALIGAAAGHAVAGGVIAGIVGGVAGVGIGAYKLVSGMVDAFKP